MLSLTSNTVRRVVAGRIPTPYQSDSQAQQARVAQAWATTTPIQRIGWRALGMQMAPKNPQSKLASLTGQQAFCSCNGVRLSCGETDMMMDAPLLWAAPPPLPSFLLIATRTTSPGLPFVVQLQSDGYDGMAQIFATAAQSAGTDFPTASRYRYLGAETLSGTDPISITGLYLDRFRAADAGQTLFVKLVPVSDSGFRGAARYASAPVGME